LFSLDYLIFNWFHNLSKNFIGKKKTKCSNLFLPEIASCSYLTAVRIFFGIVNIPRFVTTPGEIGNWLFVFRLFFGRKIREISDFDLTHMDDLLKEKKCISVVASDFHKRKLWC
jgi:hypothetical protein